MTVADVCFGKESFGATECSQAELPPVLDSVEHALDDVAGFVELFVVFKLQLAVFARRDARDCLGLGQPLAQVVGVMTAVCNDGGSLDDIRLKALERLCNIRSISCSDVQMNGRAGPVADRMQLRIQPTFGFINGPPLAGVFWTL